MKSTFLVWVALVTVYVSLVTGASRAEEPIEPVAKKTCIGVFEGDEGVILGISQRMNFTCSSCLCVENATSSTGGSFKCEDTCTTKNPKPPAPGEPFCKMRTAEKEYIRRINDVVVVAECEVCTCKKSQGDTNKGKFHCRFICFGNFKSKILPESD